LCDTQLCTRTRLQKLTNVLVIFGACRKLPTTSDLTQLQSAVSTVELVREGCNRFADRRLIFLENVGDGLHTQRLIRNEDQRLDHSSAFCMALWCRQRFVVRSVLFGGTRQLLRFGNHRCQFTTCLFIQSCL